MHWFSGLLGQKWQFLGAKNRGRGGAILTPTNSFLLLGVYTSVSNLVKIDKKCDRESDDTRTDRQTQTDFIICPMLYAIAMGQITNRKDLVNKNVLSCLLEDGREVDAVTLVGRLFHARATVTQNDWLPMVLSRVRGMIRRWQEPDRSWCRDSASSVNEDYQQDMKALFGYRTTSWYSLQRNN